jgi:dUTP pyrophosphatase
MNTISIETRILDPRIHEWGLPTFKSEMAAGIDLYACIDKPMELYAHAAAKLVSSGIAIHIGDPNIVGVVVPRSGLGHKSGVVLGNGTGIIDPDYNGPLMLSLFARNAVGSPPVIIQPGDRVAQILFLPVLHPKLEIVDDFTKSTTRGAGGFGSTGVSHVAAEHEEHRVTQYP